MPRLTRAERGPAGWPAGFLVRTDLGDEETQLDSICLNFLVNRFNTAGPRPIAGGRDGLSPDAAGREVPERDMVA